MSTNEKYYVYLLTNWNNKVIYVGVTNDLARRVYEHKYKMIKGFTEKYNVKKLVYFEETQDVNTAIEREKEIKKWRREKKNRLVNSINPNWDDLSLGW
jgi:putative endonuclease